MVTVGVATQIHATVTASAGVARVDLSVNGRVVHAITPPDGNPTTFALVQPWMPATAGDVALMVVAYDARGTPSPPAVLRLVAVDGEGMSAPQATDKPVDDVEGEGGCALNAGYVTDVTIPDNTLLEPRDSFVKTWRIHNSGTCDWDPGFKLVFVDGDHMGGPGSVAVNATAAGGTTDVSVELIAPSSPGTYRGNWRLQAGMGTFFGSTFYVQIVVPDPETEEPTSEPAAEPTAVPLPDLVVVSRVTPPAVSSLGDVVSVEVIAKNVGDGTAGGPFIVLWSCGDREDLTCKWTAGSLEPGGERSFTCDVQPYFGPGMTMIPGMAVIDPDTNVVESNESNNAHMFPIQINP